MGSTAVSNEPSTPAGKVDRIQYVGVTFTMYTPQMESQLLRDLLTMLEMARSTVDELVLVSDSLKMDRLLAGLGMRRVPTLQLAKLWISYRTEEEWPEEPEWATTVIERDLFVPVKDGAMTILDEAHSNGFYLPPQGRLCPDTISLERPAPNGYIPIDTNLFVIWG
jgi:hypothetical protein